MTPADLAAARREACQDLLPEDALPLGLALRAFYLEHGPRLLAVAEAVPPLLAYLEEEVLEAKTCEGQDEQTGKPCEWHAILLALDAAARGEKTGV